MASRNSKGRMIYWKISYCKQLARCSVFAKLLFTWLIPNADDLGRMEGDIEVLKGMLFPYDNKVTPSMIKNALTELHNEQLIIWYSYGENWYISFPNFQEYQKLRSDRVYKSDYPEPPEFVMTSHDKSCHVGQNLREEKEKRREGEGEEKENMRAHDMTCHKTPEEKIKYADFVSLTNAEYEALVAKLGEDGTKRCIEILDNYKGSTGRRYKSDYRTILNWVVQRYEDEQRKAKPKASNGNIFLREDV